MSSLNTIVGQERVLRLFDRQMTNGRLAHAYLLYGQPGVGKDALALLVARRYLCRSSSSGWGCGECPSCLQMEKLEHPGFRFIQAAPGKPDSMKEEAYYPIIREKALERVANPYQTVDFYPRLRTLPLIGINQVREMKREVMLRSGAEGRVFLVSGAHLLNQEAANSFLKLLEEPPPRTLFLLTTTAPGKIPQTITSRCQIVHCLSLSEDDIRAGLEERVELSPERSLLLARMAGGSLGRALDLAGEAFEQWRRQAQAFLEASLSGDTEALLDVIESLEQEAGKKWVHDVLMILLSIMRDLRQIGQGLGKRVINIDQVEWLNGILSEYPALEAEKGLEHVSRAIDYIAKNAYLPLVLFDLSERLISCNS